MLKKKIISGITSTGELHIGHYFSIIKPIIELQKKNNFEVYFFIADLHAQSKEKNNEKILANTKKIIALFLSCGVETEKIHFFIQSKIPYIFEFYFYLTKYINFGYLNRMVSFKEIKEKTKNKEDFIPLNKFLYPVLMSADILLYNSDFVLVGQDQKQHIELTKTIAKTINNFAKQNIFNIPKVLFFSESTKKILNLQDPSKKMSKSDENKLSFISLLDSEEEVKKKIFKAKTDSENKVVYDLEKKPGISNLMRIYVLFSDENILNFDKNIKAVEKEYASKSYFEFKKDLIVKINAKLYKINRNFKKIFSDDKLLKKKVENSFKFVKEKAENNLNNFKKYTNLI